MLENPDLERKKPLILIVDDELVGRIYIEKILQKEGYDVMTAEGGHQALELINKYAFNMIVMDVMMPDIDGYNTCIEIRKQEDRLNTPILMLTALNDIESVEKSFNAGATDFVVKPINVPIFIQRIRYGLKTRETDLQLYDNQLRLAHAHKVARLGYWDWSIKNKHLYWSDEVFNIFAISPDEQGVHGINYRAFLKGVHPQDRRKVILATRQSLKYGKPYSIEHRIILKDDSLRIVHQHAEIIKNEAGEVVRLLGIAQDVTESHIAQEKIRHLAYYDNLTSLPNRTLFHDRLNHALEIAGRSIGEVGIFIIDLDRFKNINDSLGHDIGDLFLQSVANSLNKATRSSDVVARVGGDEFAMVIEGDTSIDSVIEVAKKILTALSTTHYIDDNELISSGSIGIAISSPENRDKETLIKHADLAMYKSKEGGGNRFSFYSKEMKSQAHQLLTIENELRKALEREEFVLYYQPKVCVETNRIKGVEALIRWQHPKKGLVAPDHFIHIAEETGLIVPIGQWVLKEACQQTAKWHRQGFSDLVISINISVKQFHHTGFINDVRKILDYSAINPKLVDLEITESCIITHIDKMISILTTLRNMGVSISMDDFGTGFSSLSFLNQLPLDVLKVDREFIKNINAKGENGELAKLIIAMGKSLKLSIVAEGVEEKNHLDFLKQNGCDEFQGYYASPPVTAKKLKELLILSTL